MRRIPGIIALVFVMAACGGGGADQVASTPTADAPTPTSEPAVTTAPATTDASTPSEAGAIATGGAAAVATAETDLGEVLVDGDGFTLYLFENDSEGQSACTDECTDTWPPLTGEATAGDGADAGLLGTISRDDGSTQVTYNGHPLYRFAPDEAPGDMNGQGVGDVWWVVAPQGEAIKGSDAEGGAAGY